MTDKPTKPAHGPSGHLTSLIASDQDKIQELLKEAVTLQINHKLTDRQLCDLELILNGGFSPLEGFMNEDDYNSVLTDMRLSERYGRCLWPMPICLEISGAEKEKGYSKGQRICLRDTEGQLVAILTIESVWQPDRKREAQSVFGSIDTAHPSINVLFNLQPADLWYVGGRVEGVCLPTHYDYNGMRKTPRELRDLIDHHGWNKVVAFQTRNPMHRSHYELTVRAAQDNGCNLLLHPVVGMTKPGDVDHYTRVECYKHVITTYPKGLAMLSLLPLAMRMGGPREALWHAIIRKNYGATHFIIGRDHAGPGNTSQGHPFYGDYDAQNLVLKHEKELAIKIVPFRMVHYVPKLDKYLPEDEITPEMQTMSISGTKLRQLLQTGQDIPSWFTFPEIQTVLRTRYPPKQKQGFTVLFTGLSGAGKSTIANALQIKFFEIGGRSVTLLDGDVVRTHLSSELGFSKEHRDLNIQRIGFVCSEITKAGGIAIAAAIAPYETPRRAARELCEQYGGFCEVYVSTPLHVCEERDTKGLYAKARKGLIKGFTGIDDPYM